MNVVDEIEDLAVRAERVNVMMGELIEERLVFIEAIGELSMGMVDLIGENMGAAVDEPSRREKMLRDMAVNCLDGMLLRYRKGEMSAPLTPEKEQAILRIRSIFEEETPEQVRLS